MTGTSLPVRTTTMPMIIPSSWGLSTSTSRDRSKARLTTKQATFSAPRIWTSAIGSKKAASTKTAGHGSSLATLSIVHRVSDRATSGSRIESTTSCTGTWDRCLVRTTSSRAGMCSRALECEGLVTLDVIRRGKRLTGGLVMLVAGIGGAVGGIGWGVQGSMYGG